MANSFKNMLQEIFQKKNFSLPKYLPIRSGGSDHKPLWISTVILYDGSRFQGEECSMKNLADNSAALVALQSINANKQLTSVSKPIPSTITPKEKQYILPIQMDSIKMIIDTPTTRESIDRHFNDIYLINKMNDLSISRRTAILVDVENLQKFIYEIVERINEFTVYAFVGEHHCLVDRQLPNGVIRIISPSTRSDGTDTCMQVYVGMLLTIEAHDNYLIATRDHFGSTLVEMITCPNLGWVNKPARLVTKASQL
jgi:hypothetical protein